MVGHKCTNETKRNTGAAKRRHDPEQVDDPQDVDEAITRTRSPAERMTDSPKYVDAASTPREQSTPQHVNATFCSDKLCTGGFQFFVSMKVMLDQEF